MNLDGVEKMGELIGLRTYCETGGKVIGIFRDGDWEKFWGKVPSSSTLDLSPFWRLRGYISLIYISKATSGRRCIYRKAEKNVASILL